MHSGAGPPARDLPDHALQRSHHKADRADNARRKIEVQLERRRTSIPNLDFETVRTTPHERGTFEAVTEARAAAAGAQGPAATPRQKGFLTQALGKLFAVAEAYPDKSQHELLDLPDATRRTRRTRSRSHAGCYNDTVLTYNNAIQVFPRCRSPARPGHERASSTRSRTLATARCPRSASQPDAPAAPPASDTPSASERVGDLRTCPRARSVVRSRRQRGVIHETPRRRLPRRGRSSPLR